MLRRVKSGLVILVCTYSLMGEGYVQAGAFGFGGEEALLGEMLIEMITLVETNLNQLNELQATVSNSKANLEHLYEVHRGLNEAIRQYNTFAEFTDFSEFTKIRSIPDARRFVDEKYGYIKDVARSEHEKHVHEILVEETVQQSEMDAYSVRLNRQAEEMKRDADKADSLPKIEKIQAKASAASVQAGSALLKAQNKTNRLITTDIGIKKRKDEVRKKNAQNMAKDTITGLKTYKVERNKAPLY